MRKWFFLVFAFILAIPTWWVLAQDSPEIEITGANANNLPTITINATVIDSSNRPILDLAPADFTLGGDLEGRATIVGVENITDDSLPFAIVLVIDTSTSMSGRPLEEAKNAASLFIQAIGDNDPVAIVSFDSDARLVQDYTSDKAVLQAAIDGLFVRGRTALYDAAVLGVEVADAAPVPRRAVILLSDGAEFGGESVNGRSAGLDRALELGVPVYTIGLGYGTDRTYLQQLAEGTNARVYESPNPEELSGIYAELAQLFRSQYIITLESDIPGDGTTYNFTLQANTESGESNVAEGSFRAPIPVPIIRFEEGTFAEPFSEASLVSPIIEADQEIASVTASIDGQDVTLIDGTILIDPATLPPATYTLLVTATDVDGDSGTAEFTFETAALPATVTISGLPEGPLTEPVTVTVEIVSQTPVSGVSSTVGETNLEVLEGEDGFEIELDPLAFPAGDYELTVNVTNEGNASSTATAQISVAQVPPRGIRIEGVEGGITEVTELVVVADVQAGGEIASTSISANGQVLENNTIDPINFPAGELPLEITVTDSNGQSTTETVTVTIGSAAPRVEIGEIASPVGNEATVPVTVESQGDVTVTVSIDGGAESEVEGGEILIDGTGLGNGEHSLTITVTDENGLSTTETIDFVVDLPPTATPTPNLTETAEAEANAQATSDALATSMPQTEAASTAAAQAEISEQETLDANATRVFEDEATRDAQATSDAAPTATEEATEEVTAALVEPTATDEPTDEPTVEPTATDEATATDEPTVEPTETATVEPTVAATDTEVAIVPTDTETAAPSPSPSVAATLTPIGEIIEVDAQSAPPVQGNLTILLIVCGGALLLVVLLAIVFFGRQRRGNERSS